MIETQQDLMSLRLLQERLRRNALGLFVVRFCLLLTLPFLGFFSLFDDGVGCALAVAYVPVGLFVLWLYKKELDLIARVGTLLGSATWALMYCIYFVGVAPPELIFLAYVGAPFLLLSWHHERAILLGAVVAIATMSTIAFVDYSWSIALHFDLPNSGGYEALPGVRLGIVLCVGILVALQLGYFAYTAERTSHAVVSAMEEARDAYEAKSRFLANMSHEIRTPMNGIVGTIDILEHSGLKPSQQKSTATIRESAIALMRIIDDVLDASKMEADKLDILSTRTEVPVLFEQVALTLVPLCASQGVQQSLFIDRDLPTWGLLDGGRVRQILLNVIGNAIKYSASSLTDRPGEVSVFVRRAPCQSGQGQPCLEVLVVDNGIGMSAELVETFCQPFVQGRDAAQAKMRGTGLGMAITKRLIELMHGEMTVESIKGRGTTITLMLPYEAIDAQDTLPDLSRLRVVCLGDFRPTWQMGMQRMLGTAVRDLQFHRVGQDLGHISGSDTVFLLQPMAQDEQDAQCAQLQRRYPGASVLLGTIDRSQLMEKRAGRVFVLPMIPLLRSDLYEALSECAACADAGSADPSGIHTLAPPPAVLSSAVVTGSDPVKRVLIVDDNMINLHVLRSQLDILGHHVVSASGGEEGLTHWRENKLDLIITDCEMPDLSGYAMTRAIREEERATGRPHIPILGLTANISQGSNQRFLRSGMNDYMLKPISMDSLSAQIEQLCAVPNIQAKM